MTDSKHTPGPWSVFDEKARFPGIEVRDIPYSIVVFGGPDGADKEGVQGRTQGEAIANARLIAAAPDLLAVAEEWLSTFDGFSIEEMRKRWDEKTVQRMLRTRAAINKAKGGA